MGSISFYKDREILVGRDGEDSFDCPVATDQAQRVCIAKENGIDDFDLFILDYGRASARRIEILPNTMRCYKKYDFDVVREDGQNEFWVSSININWKPDE